MQLFQDKYPYAGGPDHYAAYLVNSDGFEIRTIIDMACGIVMAQNRCTGEETFTILHRASNLRNE